MKTITTYQIYRAAYNDILARWATETERNARCLAEHGHPNAICVHRIEKYNAQLDEIRAEILKMEQQEHEAAGC